MAYGTWVIAGRDFARMICGQCGVEFYFPEALDKKNRELGDKGGWCCPNGHHRVYSESAADQLRRERDRAIQQLAQKDDEIRRQERKVSAARGQITKIKKRAANGVCPCCNRTFADLARHMAGKHPGFVTEPTADEHVH